MPTKIFNLMDSIARAQPNQFKKQINNESQLGCKSVQVDRIIAIKSAHILYNWRTLPTIWKLSLIKSASKKSSSLIVYFSLFISCVFNLLRPYRNINCWFKSAMRSSANRKKKKKHVKYLLPFIVCSTESIMHIHLAWNAPYRLKSFQLNLAFLVRCPLTYVAKMWIPHGWICLCIHSAILHCCDSAHSNQYNSFRLFCCIHLSFACELHYSRRPSKFEHIIRPASRFVCVDDSSSSSSSWVWFCYECHSICAIWMNFWCFMSFNR